mgnify:CR=1 FL=1
MGLFKKENCCLCGGKTGMLDKKCLSGKVCKECVKKTQGDGSIVLTNN